jgi:hypothetical protein
MTDLLYFTTGCGWHDQATLRVPRSRVDTSNFLIHERLAVLPIIRDRL